MTIWRTGQMAWPHGRLLWQAGAALAMTFLVLPAAFGNTNQRAEDRINDLRNLSIEELAQIEVTSVSRRAEPVSSAPASIYVITAEDIRRSGAVSLPEALRLAPNLQVARDTTPNYAVSARGMNSYNTSNKLLVLVDGRSIYAPLYAGVLWDEEQIALEDVERIEVISGPGGTLWGANAVNGVINVLTRPAQDTQGIAARVSQGPIDRVGMVRYGGRISDNLAYRAYLRGFEQEHSLSAAGTGNNDSFSGAVGGFRLDWRGGENQITLQGDLYENDYGPTGAEGRGGNVVARWSHLLDSGGNVIVQAYYDTSEREGTGIMTRSRVSDLAMQYNLAPVGRHQIVFGGGYRYIDDFYWSNARFFLDPVSDDFQLANIFVQDTIALSDTVGLTAGLKVEHSSYSGTEYLPSLRLSWSPSEGRMVWAAVSRAVRTPVRLDRDLVAPGLITRSPGFDSESVIAYEAGYRTSPAPNLSLSVSLFFNDYDGLRVLSYQPGTTNTLPIQFMNGLDGTSYGVEAWGSWQVRDWWRLSAGLSTLEKDFDLRDGLTDLTVPPATGNDPEYQASLRSRMDFGDITFDADLRRVGDLPNPAVPAYTELNARLGWQATDRLEFAISGINLLDESHPETSSTGPADEIRRSLFVTARIGF